MLPPTAPGQVRNLANLGRTQARVVWLVIAAALAAAVVAALYGAGLVPPGPTGGLPQVFPIIACVVVVADLGIGSFVASRIRRSAPPTAPPDAVAATQVVVGSATALSGALVCCVFYFITRQALLLLLVLPCALVLLLWFPSEARWAALRPAQAPGAPQRRTMMRE